VISTSNVDGDGHRPPPCIPGLVKFYATLDFKWSLRACDRADPANRAVLSRGQLWPNLIRAAKRWGHVGDLSRLQLAEISRELYRSLILIGCDRTLQPTLGPGSIVGRAEYRITLGRFVDRGLARVIRSPSAKRARLKFDGLENDRNTAKDGEASRPPARPWPQPILVL